MTAQVWPFPQRDEFIESLEWLTDVFRAKAGEQRIALREAPRRIFNFTHTLDDASYSSALAMVRSASQFYAPDWGQAINLGPVTAGSNVILGTDLEYTDINTTAMLWESPALFEKITVSVTSNGAVAASVVNRYANARFVPLWLAYAPQGLSAVRNTAHINDCSIAMQVIENNDLGASTYAQYRGHDIIPTCPVIGSGSFNESIVWAETPFDNQTGNPYYLRTRSIPDMTFSMRWHEETRQGIYALRQWLHSRRGRQKAFWVSSRGQDLEPSGAISGTTVKVFNLAGVSALGRTAVFDIDITSTSGVSVYRRVSALSTGTPVSGRSTLDMTINASLTLPLNQIKRISFMRCARFDADRVEFEHQAVIGTAVQIPCIEIPQP